MTSAPPRIAIAFEFPTLNGGERSMLAVVDGLRERGQFTFIAIAPSTGPLAAALHERGIEHVPLDLRAPSGERRSHEDVQHDLAAAVERCGADLLHANSLAMGRLTGAIAPSLAIPSVAHLRDIIKLSGAAVSDLNRNRVIVAVSRATREFHVAQGLDGHRAVVVYNGVDTHLFRARSSSGILNRELGLPHSAFLIGTIGQIGLRKGQEILAAAAPAIVRAIPDAHFVMIGERHSSKAESVQFEADVIRAFEAAGLASRLHRLGYRNDVDQLLNELDLLVHPAHQEPLGRVLLESAAAGLPIVATNVGGTSEILEDGVSAALVPPADFEALAEAVIELARDDEMRAKYATAARRTIEQRFTIEHAASALADVWTKVLKGERGP